MYHSCLSTIIGSCETRNWLVSTREFQNGWAHWQQAKKIKGQTRQTENVLVFSDLRRRVPVEREHYRNPLSKYVYSSFFMKMVFHCVHIWSVDLFLVEDKVTVRNLIRSQLKKLAFFQECSNLCSTFVWYYWPLRTPGANHSSCMELFFVVPSFIGREIWN